MSYTKHGGFIIPGYAYPTNWSLPVGTAIPGQIKTMGGNWAVLQTSFTMASTTATTISTTGSVPDAGITAMVQASVTAGLKICLKPHVGATRDIQAHIVPGAFYSANGAHTTAGSPILSVPSASFDSTWIVRRVMNPNSGHYNDFPSGLNTLGTATPTWTTIQSITDSTHVVMSANAAGTTSTGSVVIPDDTAILTWFSNYQTIIDHLLSIATAAGTIDMIDLSTEHDFLTLLWDSNWRSLIPHVKSNYPNIKITIGMVATGGYGSVRCWDALDYIGMTWYQNVQTSTGTETAAQIETNWKNYIPGLLALSQAWSNKQIIFTELGYRSVLTAGYNPASSGGAVTVDQLTQWACSQAFLRTIWNQTWFAGFHWWTWAHPQNSNPTNEISSYSPNAKQAEMAFAQWFGVAPVRLTTNNAAQFRR